MIEHGSYQCAACGKYKSDWNAVSMCCLNIRNYATAEALPFRKPQVIRANPDVSLRVIDSSVRCGVCKRFIPIGWTVRKSNGVVACRPNPVCMRKGKINN